MPIPTDPKELVALFQRLGAPDAESWAGSQVNEGIPQLQRFLFLRQAWRQVRADGDIRWIERQIQHSERNPNGPYATVGAVLKRCLEKGVSREDLTDLARGVQAELLFQLCYLLDDPGFSEPELEDFGWGLFEVDQNDNPIPPRIGSLHESVLSTDPTGREMRPRKIADA
jgi:hypothetical protein